MLIADGANICFHWHPLSSSIILCTPGKGFGLSLTFKSFTQLSLNIHWIPWTVISILNRLRGNMIDMSCIIHVCIYQLPILYEFKQHILFALGYTLFGIIFIECGILATILNVKGPVDWLYFQQQLGFICKDYNCINSVCERYQQHTIIMCFWLPVTYHFHYFGHI